MTKSVRIENADNNGTKEIVVEEYDKDTGRLFRTSVLPYPTTLFTFTLHGQNFLKVYERDFVKI